MRTCQVNGNMMSEKSGENYPTENYCDDCYMSMEPNSEGSPIVSEQDYDASLGTECVTCGKTEEEEKAEE